MCSSLDTGIKSPAISTASLAYSLVGVCLQGTDCDKLRNDFLLLSLTTQLSSVNLAFRSSPT